MIPLTLLIIGCLLLGLLYVNRGAPKIMEVTVVIAITVIGALIFIMTNEPIRRTITPIYLVNSKDQTFLFFWKTNPVLTRHYLCQHILFSGYLHELSRTNKSVTFDFAKGERKAVIDLQVIAILDHLSRNYRNRWYIDREDIEVPGIHSVTYDHIGGDVVDDDIQKYTKDMLPQSLKQNIFL